MIRFRGHFVTYSSNSISIMLLDGTVKESQFVLKGFVHFKGVRL